jgi:hypothetical protein
MIVSMRMTDALCGWLIKVIQSCLCHMGGLSVDTCGVKVYGEVKPSPKSTATKHLLLFDQIMQMIR